MFYKNFVFSTGNMNEHKERERQQRKPDLNNILNDKIDPENKIRQEAYKIKHELKCNKLGSCLSINFSISFDLC